MHAHETKGWERFALVTFIHRLRNHMGAIDLLRTESEGGGQAIFTHFIIHGVEGSKHGKKCMRIKSMWDYSKMI